MELKEKVPDTAEPYDLIIIGAGPGGLALAAEAQASGIDAARTLVLEKGPTHNTAIRQFYPEQKLTTANYKGFAARCEGLLCISDMNKTQTIEFFDRIIEKYRLPLRYNSEVLAMTPIETASGARFKVKTSTGIYESRLLAIGIGILGRPNKPKDYPLPSSLKQKLLFDITSHKLEGEDVLVVGGGDTAAEYVQYLHQQGNRVTLSYRRSDFSRLNERNRATLLALEQRGAVTILRDSNIVQIVDVAARPMVRFKEQQGAGKVFDRVVYALGGTSPQNFLRMVGIAFNDEGPIVDAFGETNVSRLFLIGDLVVGPKGGSIIVAFNSATRAMRRICEVYLSSSKQELAQSR
jgi:thioredoxin reductase (NADPH)